MTVYSDDICHVFTNTKYILVATGQEWGTVLDINRVEALAKVETAYGITEFGFYEIKAWCEDRIIAPVCGICNQPVMGGRLSDHLRTHKVDVHG